MLAPTEFRLKNIRTFLGKHTLRLHPHLTVIVGTNNAGKSSLLLAIHAVSRKRHSDTLPGLARHGSTPDAALVFPVPFATLEATNPDIRGNARNTSGGTFPGSDDVDFCIEERGTRRCQLIGSSGNGIEYSEGGVSQYLQNGKLFPATGSSGDPARWRDVAALTEVFAYSGIAIWSHTPRLNSHPQHVSGPDTDAVRHGLTFLRMNYEGHFKQLESAVITHLEEVERIYFSRLGDGTYEPHIKLKASEVAPTISRDAFGGGAWTFLSVLTAAHVAHATGVRLLLLDEPTLFMHARLERALLRELSPVGVFKSQPLQVVIAAHSSILVDAAFRVGGLRIVDWRDRDNAEAQIIDVSRLREQGGRDAELPLNVSPAEILYAERLLFVEGPSDEACLALLANALVECPCKVVPLFQSNWWTAKSQDEQEGRFASLARISKLRLGGSLMRSRALFDSDAEEAVNAQLAKLQAHERPLVRFVGGAGHDLEALFCDADFLERLFAAELERQGLPPPQDLREQVGAAVASLGARKGDQVLYGLFTSLLREDERKTPQLARVTRFLLDSADAEYTRKVWERLAPTLDLLDALSSMSD